MPPAGCAPSSWTTESPGCSERMGRRSPSTEQTWLSRGDSKVKGTKAYLGRRSHSLGWGGEALRCREGLAGDEARGWGLSCHTESSGRGTLGPSPQAGAQGALNFSRISLSTLWPVSRPGRGHRLVNHKPGPLSGRSLELGGGTGGERGLSGTRKGLAGQGLNSRH